jgi:hypothetical protein
MATCDNMLDQNAPVAVGDEYAVRRAADSGLISDLCIFAKTCVARSLMEISDH